MEVAREASSSLLKFFDQNRTFFLWILLIISTYIKLLYLFQGTHYTHYLVSEMGMYWDQAVTSFYRGDFDPGQWSTLPSLGHLVLAWIFQVIYLFDMYVYKLEIVLVLNVLLSTLTVWFVYLIALRLYPSGAFALLVAFVYAFFFPLIYFNALILDLHPSLFALMLSSVMILYHRRGDYLLIFVSGMVLAFAVAIHPSFTATFLPSLLYLLFRDRLSSKSLAEAGLYMLGFLLVLLWLVAHTNAVSAGKVKNISSLGGVSYYAASCRKHTVHFQSRESNGSITIMGTNPEWGDVTFHVPFYQERFFYHKARACLRQHPITISEHWLKFRHLYSPNLFPIMPDTPLAKKYMVFFSKIAMWMTAALLFFPFLFRNRRISKGALLLLSGILISQVGVLYFFAIDPRDLYGFFFVIVIGSLLLPFTIIRHFKDLWWKVLLYSFLLVGIGFWYYHSK